MYPTLLRYRMVNAIKLGYFLSNTPLKGCFFSRSRTPNGTNRLQLCVRGCVFRVIMLKCLLATWGSQCCPTDIGELMRAQSVHRAERPRKRPLPSCINAAGIFGTCAVQVGLGNAAVGVADRAMASATLPAALSPYYY